MLVAPLPVDRRAFDRRQTAELSISGPGTAPHFDFGGATLVPVDFTYRGSASFGCIRTMPRLSSRWKSPGTDVGRRRDRYRGLERLLILILAGLYMLVRVNFAAVLLALAAFRTLPRLGNRRRALEGRRTAVGSISGLERLGISFKRDYAVLEVLLGFESILQRLCEAVSNLAADWRVGNGSAFICFRWV